MIEPTLCALLDRWHAAFAQGRDLSPEEVCNDCPERVAEVRSLLDGLRRRQGLAAPDPPAGSDPHSRLTEGPWDAVTGDGVLRGPDGHLLSIPGFEVVKELGRGGMGVVYLARHSRLRRFTALKMVLSGEHAAPETRRRFLAEAEAVAAIRHAGVVQVYDLGTSGDFPYLALEYCPGGSLADRLNGAPLTPTEAAGVLVQVARGIQAAHERGIVHRDLKPANVLCGEDGTWKITDFGLAKRLETPAQTRTGTLLGTPSYMAPEQAAGMKTVGPPADVYSLGAILYECLTGRPPFLGTIPMETAMQVIANDPVAVRKLQPGVPRDLETICHRCLQKDAARRYAGAQELADDLGRFLRNEPIHARPVGAVERAWKWVRRRPAVAGLLALSVLALVGGTITSGYFALQASGKAAMAEQMKREAENNAKRAKEKEEEARQALRQAEEMLALGLLRPLGHSAKGPLNEFELAALSELASLPKERDRVRLLFLGLALERPVTVGQLSRRLREAVHAAVGLDGERRGQVLAMVEGRLRDPRSSAGVRVVCARIVAELGGAGRETGRLAIEVLLRKGAESPAREHTELLDHVEAILGRLPRDEKKGSLADAVLGLAAGSTSPDQLYFLTRAWANLAGRLPAGQAASQAGRMANAVLAAMSRAATPDDLAPLEKAWTSLAGRLTEDQAAEHARDIVDRAAGGVDPDQLHFLVGAWTRIASRLSPDEAARQASRLADAVLAQTARATEPGDVLLLLQAWTSLAGRLPKDEAPRHAETVLALAADTATLYQLNFLVQVWTSLASRLSPAQAAGQASRLADALPPASKSTTPTHLALLVQAWTGLAGRLPAGQVAPQASRLADAALALAAKATSAEQLRVLSKAWSHLAVRLPAGEAARRAGALLALAVGTADPEQLGFLVQAWSSLPRPPADGKADQQAGRLADAVLALAARATGPEQLAPLSKAWSSLATRLSADEAINRADAILARAANTRALHLDFLSKAWSDLARRLPAEHAARHADAVLALAASNTDPDQLDFLFQVWSSLRSRLLAGQASRLADAALARAVNTTEPDPLGFLVRAWSSLASQLPDRQVTTQASRLADAVFVLAAAARNTDDLCFLVRTWSSLAGQLPDGKATAQASRLAEAVFILAGKAEGPDDLCMLAQAWSSLASRLHAEQAARQASRMIPRLVDALMKPLATSSRLRNRTKGAFPGFLARLSMEQIVERLKRPTCVGVGRELLLAHLRQRLRRPFRNVWEVVDWLGRAGVPVDLSTPPPLLSDPPRPRGSDGS